MTTTRPPANPNVHPLLAASRNIWRGLTSMRTALVLLFLLAVGALPAALLPQYSLNAQKVADYKLKHTFWAPILDKTGFFEVLASPWYGAIYLLLFISLAGCLVPRTIEYARQLRTPPALTPRNFTRLPHHAESTVDISMDVVAAQVKARLRGWRQAERTEPDGVRTISAERGFLREAGNLVFHFALFGLLIAFAVSKLYSYEGQVIVIANGGPASQFCNSGTLSYNTFKPGLVVDGTALTPYCVKVDSFQAKYLSNGQADTFGADVQYQGEEDLSSGQWHDFQLAVNGPLSVSGDRLFLTGHGYAPRFTVTFPDGEQRTQETQWEPADKNTLLSQGAVKFDPPGVTDPALRRAHQLAISGLFAPTAAFDGDHGGLLTSVYPAAKDPAVAIDVLRGDLGNNSGASQSIFEVDQSMVDSGRLKRVARKNLRVGEDVTLDDGSKVRFDGVDQFVNLQIEHDPSALWVLGFAVAIILGLTASLSIKRRRFWVRLTPAGADADGSRTVIELGGLARTDQAGYGEEFTTVATDIFTAAGRPPSAAPGSQPAPETDAATRPDDAVTGQHSTDERSSALGAEGASASDATRGKDH